MAGYQSLAEARAKLGLQNSPTASSAGGYVPLQQARQTILSQPTNKPTQQPTQTSTPLHLPSTQPKQQNFLQQSGNFLSGVWNGVVGEVGSVLNAKQQPQASPKLPVTQTKLPMGMKLSLTSPQANGSAQPKTTQQSLGKQQQTSKTLTNTAKAVTQTFPQTSQLFNELSIDPANFKANPKKFFTDGIKTVTDAWKQESTAFNDWAKQPVNKSGKGSTQSFNKGANVVTKTANLAFSPVSAIFNAANDVPVLGSLSKLLNLGFTAVGETGHNVAISALDHVPSNVLSTKQKNDVRQAVGEIGALAAQLATGKITEISPKTRFQLISKYGPEDTKVIVDKVHEVAKSQVVAPGTHTPQELRDQVFQKGIENTDHGKKMLATSIYAEQQGRNITISNPHEAVDTFTKNVEDYRSFGGYTAGKSTPNAALRDIQQVADTPQIKEHTQQQVQEAIKSGELKPNSDGTITLYRGGKPSSQNGLVSASYDKAVAEGFAKDGELHGVQVKPEDIKAFIGKQEKEVLIDKSALTPVEKSDIVNATAESKTEPQITSSEKTVDNLKPVGTGEETTVRLAKRVHENAVAEGLAKTLGDLPKYNKTNWKEQGKLASDYLASNEKDAMEVALGNKLPPHGTLPEAVYLAVREKAKADRNVDLINKLSQSNLTTEATAMGQRIGYLSQIDPHSPETKMRELRDARQAAFEKRTGKSAKKAVQEEVAKIKKAQGEQPKINKHDWSTFISSITC